MNKSESSYSPVYANRVTTAERELGAFIGAVAELYGPEQARLSADDWLNELALVDSLTSSTSRDWRRVTVAASARLANRLTAASAEASKTPSSNISPLPDWCAGLMAAG